MVSVCTVSMVCVPEQGLLVTARNGIAEVEVNVRTSASRSNEGLERSREKPAGTNSESNASATMRNELRCRRRLISSALNVGFPNFYFLHCHRDADLQTFL